MSRRLVALFAVALSGAAIVLPAPASAAGGIRGGFGGGGFRAPLFRPFVPRAALPVSPRVLARQAFTPRLEQLFRQNTFRPVWRAIPPSPHGYATTTPYGRLARRDHGAYHQGWYFPTTIGDDTGYIGRPYDPSGVIPVYGPGVYGPVPIYNEPADPPAARGAPATARVTNPDDENRDACRAERVTVPSGNGEREIRVVRC